MSDIYQFNVGGTTYNLANLGLLAPVQITLTADRLYNTGDQFIYTGLLYEATETIAQGTSITIGSNAQLADCVTKQISEINSNLADWQTLTYSQPAVGEIVYLDAKINQTLKLGYVMGQINGANATTFQIIGISVANNRDIIFSADNAYNSRWVRMSMSGTGLVSIPDNEPLVRFTAMFPIN